MVTKTDQLLYFVKYPEPGKVKTRLAKAIGDEEAARIYRHLAEENLKILSSVSSQVSIVVNFDPPQAEENVRLWLSSEYVFRPQLGKGLTERLTDAFYVAFNQKARRVIVIGSDTIGLSANYISQAMNALEDYDVVLGPVKDGGYCLLGLSRHQPVLFEDIPWSTDAVLRSTVAKIKERKLSYYLLPELDDLDQIENVGSELALLDAPFTKPRKPVS